MAQETSTQPPRSQTPRGVGGVGGFEGFGAEGFRDTWKLLSPSTSAARVIALKTYALTTSEVHRKRPPAASLPQATPAKPDKKPGTLNPKIAKLKTPP